MKSTVNVATKRMLEETRRELAEARERAQLTPTHTFSPLPGFFDRPAEIKAIARALEGEPSFTVLFGASSVGKVSTSVAHLNKTYHQLTRLPDGAATAGAHAGKLPCTPF